MQNRGELMLERHSSDSLEDYFWYLDKLRLSAVTNMLGAAGYLEKEFEISSADAIAILSGWLKTFDLNKHIVERVSLARTTEGDYLHTND